MRRFFCGSVYVKYTFILTQDKQDRTNTCYSLWKIQNDGNLVFFYILFLWMFRINKIAIQGDFDRSNKHNTLL